MVGDIAGSDIDQIKLAGGGVERGVIAGIQCHVAADAGTMGDHEADVILAANLDFAGNREAVAGLAVAYIDRTTRIFGFQLANKSGR